MKPRLIVFAVIASLLAMAVTISLKARPLNATAIVCNPVLVPDEIKRVRKERISHT